MKFPSSRKLTKEVGPSALVIAAPNASLSLNGSISDARAGSHALTFASFACKLVVNCPAAAVRSESDSSAPEPLLAYNAPATAGTDALVSACGFFRSTGSAAPDHAAFALDFGAAVVFCFGASTFRAHVNAFC